jgi:hypothetical protein
MKSTEGSTSQNKSLFYSAYTSMMTWLNALSASISLWWNKPGIFSSIWNSLFPSKVDTTSTDKLSKEQDEIVVQAPVKETRLTIYRDSPVVDLGPSEADELHAHELRIISLKMNGLDKSSAEFLGLKAEYKRKSNTHELTVENDVTLNATDAHSVQLESNGTKSQNLTRHIPTCLGLVAGMALLPKSLEVLRKNPKALSGLAMFATVGIGTGLLCNSVLSGKKIEVKAEDTPETLDEPKGGSVFELVANTATFGLYGFVKNAVGDNVSDEESLPKKAFR